MSAFSENTLLKKLAELNPSQQSIQTLSLWLIHHRKHHVAIVKTWLRELQNVSEDKKLVFMYLANDVIQNSKKKGPEYNKEFSTVLAQVFTHMGEKCKSDKLIGSLGRILNIWEERGVYDSKLITELRARLNRDVKDASAGGAAPSVTAVAASSSRNHKTESKKEKSERREKRKHEEAAGDFKFKRPRPPAQRVEAAPPEEVVDLSPYIPTGEPPEPEELIKALTNMENTASGDAVVRERIANLPPEISEISCLSKLEDKETAQVLAKQVNEAVQLLNEYNARLQSEMEDRTKLASMLRNSHAEQRELLIQAEARCDEYTKKLNKMRSVQKELKKHISNLPDLSRLPNVLSGGLEPLPSAGDLFNIH